MTLQDASQLAPVVTAVIALAAVIIAGISLSVQRTLARRRAAIDFFLKTDLDKTLIDLYDFFKEKAPSIKSESSMEKFSQTDDYKKVRSFLNVCELISVGVMTHTFSDIVCWAYWGDVLRQSYQDAKPLIEYVRKTPGQGTPDTYIAIEWLNAKWQHESAFLENWCYG